MNDHPLDTIEFITSFRFAIPCSAGFLYVSKLASRTASPGDLLGGIDLTSISSTLMWAAVSVISVALARKIIFKF